MHILPLLGLSLASSHLRRFCCVAFLRAQAELHANSPNSSPRLASSSIKHTLQLTQRSELDTLKDEFISTVSHELRTPLTSIRGALGLLSSGIIGDVDAKALNLLRIAVTNTDRLIRLINDILDLERMESGRAPLQIRRCSLRDLAQQAIETMTPMADGNTVHLALEPSTVGPGRLSRALFFDGDADRILQVLTNLLSNAIKFSPRSLHRPHPHRGDLRLHPPQGRRRRPRHPRR